MQKFAIQTFKPLFIKFNHAIILAETSISCASSVGVLVICYRHVSWRFVISWGGKEGILTILAIKVSYRVVRLNWLEIFNISW